MRARGTTTARSSGCGRTSCPSSMAHSRSSHDGRPAAEHTFADLLPFRGGDRLWLTPPELPFVHPARPGETHGHELCQVAQRLLHPALAFAVAVQEDSHD